MPKIIAKTAPTAAVVRGGLATCREEEGGVRAGRQGRGAANLVTHKSVACQRNREREREGD